MKVFKNGTLVNMTYEDICRELEFIPDINFVKVTNCGTISFTCGKPDEIKTLRKNVIDNGYKLSVKLGDDVIF